MIGEDSLSCVLGERLVAEALPKWTLARDSINTAGITKLVSALPRYAQLARNMYPVLCVADTDGGCPLKLLQMWTPAGATDDLLVRLAVKEAESWLLADRQAVAQFFDVPLAKVPVQPDELSDPKSAVLRLARSSKVKTIRQEVASQDPTKPGAGYVTHLREFARRSWQASRAADQSPSLRRALARMAVWSKARAVHL